MGPTTFCKRRFERLPVQGQVSDKLLQPPVLVLEFLQTLCLVDFEAVILGSLVVDRACTHAVLSGEVSDLRSAFGLLQNPNDLGLCELTLSCVVLLDGCTQSSQELLERLTGAWSGAVGAGRSALAELDLHVHSLALVIELEVVDLPWAWEVKCYSEEAFRVHPCTVTSSLTRSCDRRTHSTRKPEAP